MTFYQSFPAFQTGQLFSSTSANQLYTNLDAVYGLDQRQEPSQYGRFNDDTDPFNDKNTWYGWVVFNGDQLVVRMEETINANYDITFDFGGDHPYTVRKQGVGPHTIPLAVANYVQWKPYRIEIKIEEGINEIEAYPRYVYMTYSQFGHLAAMPAFTNGTALTAVSLNTLRSAADVLYSYFNQPVPPSVARAFTPDGTVGAGIGSGRYFDVWAPYRHTWFQFYLRSGSTQQHSCQLTWGVFDGAEETVFWDSYDETNPFVIDTPKRAYIGNLGLSVGTWYKWRFTHGPASGGGTQNCNVFWYGQERFETAGNWNAMYRWEYGDVVNGSASDAGTPKLVDASNNLDWLDNNRSRFVNYAQRETWVLVRDNLNNYAAVHTAVWHTKRVHRWLAYQPLDADSTVTLKWSMSDDNVFQSYDLPTLEGNAYCDLDESPIKLGQTFYICGALYAIQTPDRE